MSVLEDKYFGELNVLLSRGIIILYHFITINLQGNCPFPKMLERNCGRSFPSTVTN